jgi:ferrochelatase
VATPYDALLVVSFGGPAGPDDVLPFLGNVLRGKNVPRARVLAVAEHYQQFGGKSPINDQNRALIAALRPVLAEAGVDLPIYWGNRNWHPLLPDTLAVMAQAGVRRALAFFTSALSSYSGCRQYHEDIARAQAQLGPTAPPVDKLRAFYNHPGYIAAMAARVREALERLSPAEAARARLVFTAHSIPQAMAAGCRYEEQLRESSRLVAEAAGRDDWTVVYQSRSGPANQPWLEPDVGDYLRSLAERGAPPPVVLVPIGFISDHMEVLYDLDTEARELCDELGLTMVRAATAGTHPAFIGMIRDLIVERLTGTAERPARGCFPASHDVCPEGCCPSGRELLP